MYLIFRVFYRFLKLIRIIGSTESSTKISLGMVIGVFWGLIPILQPINFLLLLVIFIFKISLRGAILMVFPVWLLSYLVAPTVNKIGKTVLTYPEFIPWFEKIYNSYFVLTNFNNTYVMGSLVLGLGLAIPVFFLMKWFINSYREKIQEKILNSKIYVKFLSKIPILRSIISEDKEPIAVKYKKSIIPFDLKTFLPIAIFTTLILVGFKFYFDSFLKDFLAEQATKYNKAEVRIGDLTTSFFNARLDLKNLEWVDSKNQRNHLFEIQNFVGDMKLQPILQKRFVTEKIWVEGIDFNTINPAYKEPKKEPEKKPVTTASSDSGTGEGENTSAGDGANSDRIESDDVTSKGSSESADSSSKIASTPNSEIQEESKVKKEASRITGIVKDEIAEEKRKIEKENQQLVENYQKRFEEIRQEIDIDQEIATVKKIDVNNINNLQDANKALEQIKAMNKSRKKIQNLKRSVEELKKDFDRDQKKILAKIDKISQIEQIGKDRLLKLLDKETFSQDSIFERILGQKINNYLVQGLDLYEQYKHLLPDDSKEEEAALEKSRKGRVIHYRNYANYPTFLIEDLKISGNPDKDGLVRATLQNISSDLTYKPLTSFLVLRLDDLIIRLNGRVEMEDEGLWVKQDIGVDPFPLARIIQVSGNPFITGVKKGTAQAKGILIERAKGDTFRLTLNIIADQAGFNVNPKADPIVRQILERSLSSIPTLTIKIVYEIVQGKQRIIIASNLDQILSKSMNEYFENLFKEQKKEMLKLYEKELAKLDKNWIDQIEKQSGVGGVDQSLKKIDSYENQVDQTEKAVQEKKKREEDKVKKQAEEKAKQQIKKVVPKQIKKLF